MKHPWFKFWPSNWLGDTQLRLCPLEVRGFLIDCLALMHDAKRRGYLETPTGKPIDDDMLARLIGADKGDVYRSRLKVIEEHILSVEPETGVLYSRKMVKTAEKAAKCAKAGKRGGGNPGLSSSKIDKDKKIEDRMIDDIYPKGTFKGHPKGQTKSSPKPKKLSYGEFQNVTLTAEEHAKLLQKHGEAKLSAGIEELGAWLERTGKRRKSHYACLHAGSWVWEKVAEKKKSAAGNVHYQSEGNDKGLYEYDG
jgi:hypothetical protein